MNNTTKRGYLTIDELQRYADITVTNELEAYEQIEMAEEAIDNYVGPQGKFNEGTFTGEITGVSGNNKTFYDTSPSTRLFVTNGYYSYFVLEIVAGTGAGQSRRIVDSNQQDRSVTVGLAFTVTPDTTSIFRMYQLGKFPRWKDSFLNSAGDYFYKTIPDAVKRATAAQVAFMISKGDDYFNSDDSDKVSEHIGNYSYSRGGSASANTTPLSIVKLVAPKARNLLSGYVVRTGKIKVDNPTWL